MQGLNENINELVQQYFLNRTDFNEINDAEICCIVGGIA